MSGVISGLLILVVCYIGVGSCLRVVLSVGKYICDSVVDRL